MKKDNLLFSKSCFIALSLACCVSYGFYQPAHAEKVLSGQVCAQRVCRLTSEIQWQKSVDDARQLAKKEHKLVFWINMLGKLDGDT